MIWLTRMALALKVKEVCPELIGESQAYLYDLYLRDRRHANSNGRSIDGGWAARCEQYEKFLNGAINATAIMSCELRQR